LAQSNTIKVPQPVCLGEVGNHQFLVVEYLELGHSGDARALGEKLAQMHQVTHSSYGWYRDNTIGSTPQINDYKYDWAMFFAQNRLQFQFDLAARNGFDLYREGDQLLGNIRAFFTDYKPQPSLLHGDLWSGNYSFTSTGEPVIFDPAVYYGDRETDLAMTELFGGFSRDFYAAYDASLPLDTGYAVRKHLYNLYHVVNHLNLFGSSYLAQAQRLMQQLLSEIR
jgi:fructosamine-3-kinase